MVNWALAGRALALWLLIALLESVHGVLRELWLVPRVGEAAAHPIGFAVGSLLVIAVATLGGRWLRAPTRAAQWQVGVLWLMLMLSLELAVGRARGYDWPRIAAEFDPSRGGLMAFGLLLMLLAPTLGTWLRRPSAR